jgi:hypothetical protein
VLKKPQADQNEYMRNIGKSRGESARLDLAKEMIDLQKPQK